MSAESFVRFGRFERTPLTVYLSQLAADWTGWTETRHWQSLERELLLDARHAGLGHVTFGVTLRPSGFAHTADGWSVRTTFIVEAGEQMINLVNTAEAFLNW
jgi:hypothetical protein